MTSPFVRRRRLGIELRAIREERGLTADQLAKLIHYSRMKISRLETGQVRPDVSEVIKIMDALEITGEQWNRTVRIACDAAERGWWDSFGDAMGARQRMYADIESGAATICEYNQTAIPGVLQLPEFIAALIDLTRASEGNLDFKPEKMTAARLQRQRAILHPDGPVYEIVLDEVVIRRLNVPPEIMAAQLHHMVKTVPEHPGLTVRVLPVDARLDTVLPRSTFTLYTFPDPDDPPMAAVSTISTDNVHTEPDEVQRYTRRYESLRRAALSSEDSLALMAEVSERTTSRTGPT
ncbi:XRE family transcriptional regulator [Actinomadura craniellae]|uniref:XRE family transcriptional regulator n=1 Tax=Actinomadura craniellae TaxID=2231787 RepID=A0A365HDN7_9ACTN|nr:helix-turn-helix transcriptional regulator [Actinomadura craniellae]RAY17128.1 XRE family transcriptional regulator [Actinomadura craniellae]